jgi:phosphatidylserine decarboxylase
MDTKHFGRLAQIEVGAMLVGRVENYKGAGVSFRRGEEKGRFLYGGSTVVLLLQKDRVKLDAELFENTENGLETPVKLGEVLGQSL